MSLRMVVRKIVRMAVRMVASAINKKLFIHMRLEWDSIVIECDLEIALRIGFSGSS